MAATATISGALQPPAKTGFNKRHLAAFLFMVFGMFMAILDIQIVSSSLAEIQAGISASADEISWVQTSYLIAEVVMIPLSGMLSRILSTRILFTVSAIGFTAMSFMCAMSGSINEMIVWRALQGFVGGAMIPTVFAVTFTVFPADKRVIITPVIGLIATLAPTIGPTVGGYLTDLFSWHWLFLINVIPGIAVAIGAWLLIDFDKPDFKLAKTFDWAALALLAVFLGTLEYALEEGPAENWFESRLIFFLTLTCIASGSGILLAGSHLGTSAGGFHRLQEPQLCFRLDLFLHHGHRALWPYLSLSRLSGAGAQLFRPADRRNAVRHRRCDVSHRTHRRTAFGQA